MSAERLRELDGPSGWEEGLTEMVLRGAGRGTCSGRREDKVFKKPACMTCRRGW